MNWKWYSLYKKKSIEIFLQGRKKFLDSFFAFPSVWLIGSSCFFFFLLTLPLLYYRSYLKQYTFLEKQLFAIEGQNKRFSNTEEEHEGFIKNYPYRDQNFLQRYVEPLRLLEREIKTLTTIHEKSMLSGYSSIEERLSFLLGSQNRLSFQEKSSKKSHLYLENIYHLAHSVQGEQKDIENILAQVEGVIIDSFSSPSLRPQLFFISFSLKRDPLKRNEAVYNINMEILERVQRGSSI